MVDAPEGLDDFLANPLAEQPIAPQAASPDAMAGQPEGLDAFIADAEREEKYGTMGQQLKTAAEGAASALTFGTSTGAQVALGISTPEDIRARKETNPGAYMAGNVAGLVGSALIPGVGAANLATKAGVAGAKAVGAVGGASLAAKAANMAVRGAFEAGILQGGEEVSNMFSADPALRGQEMAETALANIGLAAVLGGGVGGAIGAGGWALKEASDKAKGMFSKTLAKGEKIVSEVDQAAIDAGDFRAAVANADELSAVEKKNVLSSLGEQIDNAKEARQALESIGGVYDEGMFAKHKVVQMARDKLNNSGTAIGLKHQELNSHNFKKVADVADQVLGVDEALTKAQAGERMAQSLAGKIQQENAPIAALYDDLKRSHAVIPLADNNFAPSAIARRLEQLPDFKLSPRSPEARLAKDVMREIEGLKTVDDVKRYTTSLRGRLSPTASPNEKRMVGVLADQLKELEEHSVMRFANKQLRDNPEEAARIAGLIDQRKVANQQYKGFINKVQELSEQLGKRRVYGAQDAINFIQDLTPESVTQKLFAKNNSKFLTFFEKNFPDEMATMRSYQKNAMREAATVNGEFSPRRFFTAIGKLEPEIQKALFSADELKRLADAENVLNYAIPKNFNPSGTAYMTALGQLTNPASMISANLTDLALDKLIKSASGGLEAAKAGALAQATVQGAKALKKGVNAVFNPVKQETIQGVTRRESQREKLAKMVEEYVSQPEKLLDMGLNNPIPEYNQVFSSSAARAISYLNSLRPQVDRMAPLDPGKLPINNTAKAKYSRALDLANNPNLVLSFIKEGTLQPSDVEAIATMYPDFYQTMVSQLTTKITDVKTKGQIIPFATRQSLSMFMGQALDSSLTPQAIQSSQSIFMRQPAGPQQQGTIPAKPPSASSMKGLGKMPQSYQTQAQARAARAQRD